MKPMYSNKMYLLPVVVLVWKGMLVDVRVHLLAGGCTSVYCRVLLSLESCDATTGLLWPRLVHNSRRDTQVVFFQTIGLARFVALRTPDQNCRS